MDSFFTMLRLQLMLLIFLTVGIYIRKRNIVTKEAQPYFTEFLARIALPCMIFNSFKSESGLEILLSASKMLTVSFVVCLFSFVLGKILYSHISPERRSVMRYGTLVSNAGVCGIAAGAEHIRRHRATVCEYLPDSSAYFHVVGRDFTFP